MAVELFANATSPTTPLATTLNGGINATATTLTVTSSTGFPAAVAGVSQFRALIENEIVLVIAVSGTSWTVVRGVEGSVAAAHATGVAVTYTLTADALMALAPFPSTADYQFNAQTLQPWYLGSVTTTNTGSGRQLLVRTRAGSSGLVSGVSFGVRTAGATFTTGNEIGLFDGNGTLLTRTGDLSTVWNSTGFKTAPFAATQQVTAGQPLYLGVLASATTLPALLGATGDAIAQIVANHGGTTSRPAYVDNTSRTALLSTYNLATLAVSNQLPWLGLT